MKILATLNLRYKIPVKKLRGLLKATVTLKIVTFSKFAIFTLDCTYIVYVRNNWVTF